jgi:hypothetical protein
VNEEALAHWGAVAPKTNKKIPCPIHSPCFHVIIIFHFKNSAASVKSIHFLYSLAISTAISKYST